MANLYRSAQPRTTFSQKILLIAFGALCCIILLEVGLRLGGLALTSLQEHRNYASLRQKSACRILCLGESTTARQYPPFLEEELNRRNIGVKFSVIDKGAPGTNTAAILYNLKSYLYEYNPDIVITMMGINDAGKHMPLAVYSDSKAMNFLRSFRTYKLNRLLWLHIVNKLNELIRIILLNPKDYKTYIWLGWFYHDHGNFPKSETAFKKATKLKPINDEPYVSIGWFYRDWCRFPEAEASFKKAIQLNPRNYFACFSIGCLYQEQGKLPEAEAAFKKPIELNANYYAAYHDLGWFYRDQGRLPEAEAAFTKAVELDPNNYEVYFGLGKFYIDQRRFPEAEAAFKKAIELKPNNDMMYRALSTLYSEADYSEIARKYTKKTRYQYGYPALTISNYRKLKAILDERGISYVCAQYPMRDIQQLKDIFLTDAQGVIFVDNKSVFEKAIRQGSYAEYFRDMFGGVFGHCTKKGNRLLAENIADVIVKEVFNK